MESKETLFTKREIAKLHLHVTNRCTSYCRHCSSAAGPHGKRSLTREDFQYIVDWATESGVTWLELSGGEPFTLKEDLFTLIQYADEKGLYVSLLSNGCLIDEEKAHSLKSVGTKQVGISIYGTRPETHDDFTQTPGSFSQTIRGMRNVISAGIETVANVVVTPQNLQELQLLPSLVEGIDLYTFGSIVPAGRGATLTGYTFSESGYVNAIENIEDHFSGISHYFMISLYPYPSENLKRYCMRPVDETTINHEGQLIPCCVLPEDLRYREGNVKERNFNHIKLDDPVFQWLEGGHHLMCETLHYSPVSHNLCKDCIAMLQLLSA